MSSRRPEKLRFPQALPLPEFAIRQSIYSTGGTLKNVSEYYHVPTERVSLC